MGRGCKTWWACNIEISKSNTFINTNIRSSLYQCYCLSSHSVQFVTISFFLKNARAYCTFHIYLAKPLSKVHVCNKRSNSDYDPQDILLHSRMVNKLAKNCDTEKLNLSEKLSVEYHFKPLLRNTRLTRLTSFNVPGNSEMNRSTFHRSTSCIFFKSGDKRKQIQHCKYLLKEKRCNLINLSWSCLNP